MLKFSKAIVFSKNVFDLFNLLTFSLYFGKVESMNNLWRLNKTTQLVKVLCGIPDAETMQNFLRDVMTEKEIIEISSRLEAAKMLANGNKYDEVIEATKLSSRTVARVSEWLRNGCRGYKEAISLINNHHSITS